MDIVFSQATGVKEYFIRWTLQSFYEVNVVVTSVKHDGEAMKT